MTVFSVAFDVLGVACFSICILSGAFFKVVNFDILDEQIHYNVHGKHKIVYYKNALHQQSGFS